MVVQGSGRGELGINTAAMPDDAAQPPSSFFTSPSHSLARLTHFIDDNIRIIQVCLPLTFLLSLRVASDNSCSRQPNAASPCRQLVPADRSQVELCACSLHKRWRTDILTNTMHISVNRSVTNKIVYYIHALFILSCKEKIENKYSYSFMSTVAMTTLSIDMAEETTPASSQPPTGCPLSRTLR